jgi:DNA repair protein RecN (Recombination protein N)
MLVELLIRKMALIEESTLSFGRGLNVITGETGAGKSLLVGALDLLMGQRTKPGLVRAGARQLLVEGRFVVPDDPSGEAVRTWLEAHLPEVLEEWAELESGEERELILGRSVAREGRSRAHVNHRPVTQRTLRELAGRLFEVHGQNDHQRLLEPGEQLRLLDAFGGLHEALSRYRDLRAAWLGHVQRALELQAERDERRDTLELARFQLAELESARPDAAERASLAQERDLVAELSEQDDALLDRLRRAERLVEDWSRDVAAFDASREELAAAVVHLQEAAGGLRSSYDRLELDPGRLEAVEGRLEELERLERKYARDTAGLAARIEELRVEIARLEGEERDLEDLAPTIVKARADLLESGFGLRRSRKAVAVRFKSKARATFKQLGLERADFDVRLGQRAPEAGEPGEGDATAHDREAIEHDRLRFGERGMDKIEFLLAANPGEPAGRLRQVASGGETARIMLALRSVLGAADTGRTLVFDEIDSGVGGHLGPAVGVHLKRLARRHQVLCVTHLPAIAAVADRHLRVSKAVRKGRTLTQVSELSGEDRVQEVADMIAGGSAHETARAEARRLIGS